MCYQNLMNTSLIDSYNRVRIKPVALWKLLPEHAKVSVSNEVGYTPEHYQTRVVMEWVLWIAVLFFATTVATFWLSGAWKWSLGKAIVVPLALIGWAAAAWVVTSKNNDVRRAIKNRLGSTENVATLVIEKTPNRDLSPSNELRDIGYRYLRYIAEKTKPEYRLDRVRPPHRELRRRGLVVQEAEHFCERHSVGG